jgi:transcription antitermination factor NusG
MLYQPTELQPVKEMDAFAWHVLYTRHQHEKAVAETLTSKGFDVMLPLYSSARRWKDRTKLLTVPLFPCYVFLKGGLERRSDVMKTPGVHALVSSAAVPATVPSAEIEAIQRIIENGSKVEPHPFLQCGDRVRVKDGPLAGLEGILVRKKTVYRLILSVAMLGKSAAVEVEWFLVERLVSSAAVAGIKTCDRAFVPALLNAPRANPRAPVALR